MIDFVSHPAHVKGLVNICSCDNFLSPKITSYTHHFGTVKMTQQVMMHQLKCQLKSHGTVSGNRSNFFVGCFPREQF